MGRLGLTDKQILMLFDKNIPTKTKAQHLGVSEGYISTLKYRYKKRIEKVRAMEREPQNENEERLSRIDALLREAEIEPEDIRSINSVQVSTYEMVTKDNDGEPQVHELKATKVNYVPVQDQEDLDVVREAPPVNITPARVTRKKSKDKRAIIIPDLQGGYRRVNGELEPIHDESVVSVGLQIIRHSQPDLVVLNGDNVDFAELSHFDPDSNHFQQTLQATIDRVHEIMATIRASAPNAQIVWLAGNHEQRLNKAIVKHNMALWGIRRPGDDTSWLSIEHLMRLDELEIDYVSGYPANTYRINDRLQAMHGHKVRSQGSTAALLSKDEELSTIFGHVHRIEQHARTNRLGRMIMAVSAGTWARIDGPVPSYGNGVDDNGNVVEQYENWQNGIGTVEYRDGDKPFQWQATHIDHQEGYETHYDGKVFKPEE